MPIEETSKILCQLLKIYKQVLPGWYLCAGLNVLSRLYSNKVGNIEFVADMDSLCGEHFHLRCL